jgi:hypothetical protein
MLLRTGEARAGARYRRATWGLVRTPMGASIVQDCPTCKALQVWGGGGRACGGVGPRRLVRGLSVPVSCVLLVPGQETQRPSTSYPQAEAGTQTQMWMYDCGCGGLWIVDCGCGMWDVGEGCVSALSLDSLSIQQEPKLAMNRRRYFSLNIDGLQLVYSYSIYCNTSIYIFRVIVFVHLTQKRIITHE